MFGFAERLQFLVLWSCGGQAISFGHAFYFWIRSVRGRDPCDIELGVTDVFLRLVRVQ